MSDKMENVLPEDEYQKIDAKAFAANPQDYHKAISDFADAYGLSYGQAMQFMIKPDEDSTGTVVEDYLERRGFVMETTKEHQSTPTPEVFDNDADTAAAVEWAKDEYFSSIHTDDFYLVGTQPVQFAASTRGGLNDAINRPNYGPLQTTYMESSDIQLSDIIARRIPVRGNTYLGPNIDKPDDYNLTHISEGADLPEYYMSTGKDTNVLVKAGYATRVTYELLRTNNSMSLEALGEFSRMLGFITSEQIVNEGLTMIAGAAEASDSVNGGGGFDKKEFIKLVGQRKAGTTYNTIVGTLNFMAEYLGVDLSYNSANDAPGLGARTLIEQLVGTQRLGIRTSAEVAQLTGSKGLLFDKRYMLEYLFERGGEISEQKREQSNQTIAYYNTFNYAFRLTSFASDSKAIIADLA